MEFEMEKLKTNSFILFFLILLLILIGAAILWIGVPLLATNHFGPPANNLTAAQRWTYSLQVLINEGKLTSAVSTFQDEQQFNIPSGASVTTVAMDLQNQGLIPSWQALRYYIIYKGLDTVIIAGDFTLSPSMTPLQITSVIISTYSEEVSFYIYPGWRAEEIAAALPTSGIEVTPEAFLSLVQNPSSLNLPANLQGSTTLEGFLFPGTYTINRKITPEELVLTFVQRFEDTITPEIQTEMQNNGLSFHQAVVLASIIQRETFDENERPMMASVFYNRLASGMKLETDPTVQYALGYNAAWGGWWKSLLMISDLAVQSPYNTYIIPGLPEHPISNPDLASILAVAKPEKSSYYYFRAKCDGSGSHVFSKTFEEHLANACP
jgi:UPF0755 protein